VGVAIWEVAVALGVGVAVDCAARYVPINPSDALDPVVVQPLLSVPVEVTI